MTETRKSLFGIVLTLTLIIAGGCNSGQLPTCQVNGQFRFEDGTTPMFGDVEFHNAEHKINARGKINRDGSFTVGTYDDNDGAVQGEHQVVIVQHTANYLTAHLDIKIDHDHGELVHPDYFDYRTSSLKCVIEKGDNDVQLVLLKNPSQTGDGLPLEQ